MSLLNERLLDSRQGVNLTQDIDWWVPASGIGRFLGEDANLPSTFGAELGRARHGKVERSKHLVKGLRECRFIVRSLSFEVRLDPLSSGEDIAAFDAAILRVCSLRLALVALFEACYHSFFNLLIGRRIYSSF